MTPLIPDCYVLCTLAILIICIEKSGNTISDISASLSVYFISNSSIVVSAFIAKSTPPRNPGKTIAYPANMISQDIPFNATRLTTPQSAAPITPHNNAFVSRNHPVILFFPYFLISFIASPFNNIFDFSITCGSLLFPFTFFLFYFIIFQQAETQNEQKESYPLSSARFMLLFT